jgi:hypothetical protein
MVSSGADFLLWVSLISRTHGIIIIIQGNDHDVRNAGFVLGDIRHW